MAFIIPGYNDEENKEINIDNSDSRILNSSDGLYQSGFFSGEDNDKVSLRKISLDESACSEIKAGVVKDDQFTEKIISEQNESTEPIVAEKSETYKEETAETVHVNEQTENISSDADNSNNSFYNENNDEAASSLLVDVFKAIFFTAKSTKDTANSVKCVCKDAKGVLNRTCKTLTNSFKSSLRSAKEEIYGKEAVYNKEGVSLGERFIGFGQKILAAKQEQIMYNKFKSGIKEKAGNYKIRIIGDSPENGEICITTYSGPEKILRIPETISGYKVTYILPDFLSNKRIRGAVNAISNSNKLSEDIGTIANYMSRVEQIRLPKYLEYIPKALFSQCSSLSTIVIPASVINVSYDFLKDSAVKLVFFEGECPVGLKYARLPSDTVIMCKKEYSNSYIGIKNLKIK